MPNNDEYRLCCYTGPSCSCKGSTEDIPDGATPVTMSDGLYCDPECPYLQTSPLHAGVCGKDGSPLSYYDWYLAHCNDQENQGTILH